MLFTAMSKAQKDEANSVHSHELVKQLAVKVVRLRALGAREDRSEQSHLLDDKVLVIDQAPVSRVEGGT